MSVSFRRKLLVKSDRIALFYTGIITIDQDLICGMSRGRKSLSHILVGEAAHEPNMTTKARKRYYVCLDAPL